MIATKEEMCSRAIELSDKFTDDTQAAFDRAKEFYTTAGQGAGMPQETLYSIFNKLTDQVNLMSAVLKRVIRHLDNVSDDEFRVTKMSTIDSDARKSLDDLVISDYSYDETSDAGRLCAEYVRYLSDAFDDAKRFYVDCGRVNGMSYTYELCKIRDAFNKMIDVVDQYNPHKDVVSRVVPRLERSVDSVVDTLDFNGRTVKRLK